MTSRTRDEQPKGAGTPSRTLKDDIGRGERVPGDRTVGLLMLGAAAVLATFFLAAAPARTQETTNTLGPEGAPEMTVAETEDDSPKVGDGRVETSDGGRSVRVGDGCVVIEDEGGKDLVVGSCGEGDDGGGQSGEDEGPEGHRWEEERTAPEQTGVEGTILEETAPGTTNLEEPAVPEATVPEGTALEGGAGAECPTAPEGETFEATVERAVDGDTLELAEPVDGVSRVRLIGVDAPELEGEGGEPEPYAEEAAAFTASELEGSRVLLELDREATDPYGRLLANVWHGQEGSSQEEDPLSGGEGRELFGLALLQGGYATATPVEPNTRYADCFDRAEQTAREEGSGLPVPSPTSEAAEGPEETSYGSPEPTTGTAPEFPEEPAGETTGVPSAQYEAPDAPTEAPAAGNSGIEASGETGTEPAPEPADALASTLPARQTPAGPVPVLPDTGGVASLPLLFGASCLALGLLSLRSPSRRERQGDRRDHSAPGER